MVRSRVVRRVAWWFRWNVTYPAQDAVAGVRVWLCQHGWLQCGGCRNIAMVRAELASLNEAAERAYRRAVVTETRNGPALPRPEEP